MFASSWHGTHNHGFPQEASEGERFFTKAQISRNVLLCIFLKLRPPPHKVLIIGNLAKKLYSIPYPVSYFVIVAYFSINFIYNACDLAGIVGSTPRVLNNLIPITCP